MTDLNKTVFENYLIGRQSRRSLQYRLHRRGKEISRALKMLHFSHIQRVLDVGVAEGKMLLDLRAAFPNVDFMGLDISLLLLIRFDSKLYMVPRIQADACHLPFRDASFDAVVAAAVVEHMSDANMFVQEARRVLRRGGGVIITTPDPFWDKVAGFLGLMGEGHDVTFSKTELVRLCAYNGLELLKYRKFMVSPIGMPLEDRIEGILRRISADSLMANQIIVARKA